MQESGVIVVRRVMAERGEAAEHAKGVIDWLSPRLA